MIGVLPVPRALATIGDRLASTVYAGAALVGAIVAPPHATLIVAPVCAALVATAWVAAHVALVDLRPTGRSTCVATCLAFGLPLFLHGAAATGDAGSASALLLLPPAVAHGLPWVRAMWSAGRPLPQTALPDLDDESSLRDVLAAISLRDRFDEWRATQTTGSFGDLRTREMIIDELRWRDPAGVEHWLADGAGQAPEHYIGRDAPRNP